MHANQLIDVQDGLLARLVVHSGCDASKALTYGLDFSIPRELTQVNGSIAQLLLLTLLTLRSCWPLLLHCAAVGLPLLTSLTLCYHC